MNPLSPLVSGLAAQHPVLFGMALLAVILGIEWLSRRAGPKESSE